MLIRLMVKLEEVKVELTMEEAGGRVVVSKVKVKSKRKDKTRQVKYVLYIFWIVCNNMPGYQSM